MSEKEIAESALYWKLETEKLAAENQRLQTELTITQDTIKRQKSDNAIIYKQRDDAINKADEWRTTCLAKEIEIKKLVDKNVGLMLEVTTLKSMLKKLKGQVVIVGEPYRGKHSPFSDI